MPRKKLVEENTMSLDELVVNYCQHKEESDKVGKLAKEENTKIKDIMSKQKLSEYTSGDYTVKYSEVESNKMNEDKLLEVLKKHGITSVIKTTEYVDSDLLEKALYNNEVPKEVQLEIAGCNEIKVTQKLTYKKAN